MAKAKNTCDVVEDLYKYLEEASKKKDKADRKEAVDGTVNFRELAAKLPSKSLANIQQLHQAAGTICSMLDMLAAYKLSTQNEFLTPALNCVIVQLNQEQEKLELKMQKEWGIKQDPNKHTWWQKPQFCRCPRMDNTDPAYFGMGKIIAGDCPVHGIELQEKIKK